MKKIKITKFSVICIILDLLAFVGFFIMYGPFDKIRNLYVTTAMKTMNHQYLAKVFYSDQTIEKIMASNYIVPITDTVILDDIIINTKEKKTYKDEYEKELLTRNPGNDLYKVINVEVGNAKGYLVAIYDPTKVEILTLRNWGASSDERVVDMCNRYGGVVCINGGGFTNGFGTGSGTPDGYVIANGQISWSNGDPSIDRGDIIGITGDGKLTLMANTTGIEAINAGIVSGLEFGPFLIVNGKAIEIVGTPYGVANKCVIAQRKDGVMMFLVTEGETYIDGASLQDVVTVLEKYGAYNAANLDGGQSTSLVVNGTMINSPNYLAKKQGGRYVVTGWGLIP